MRVSKFGGVVFVEGVHPLARILGPLKVSVRGQLKNLDDVIAYGQKQRGPLSFSFTIDLVDWYGTGQAAVLPPNALRVPE